MVQSLYYRVSGCLAYSRFENPTTDLIRERHNSSNLSPLPNMDIVVFKGLLVLAVVMFRVDTHFYS